MPDIRVAPIRWAETDDGSVLIEWSNTGTLRAWCLSLHPQRDQLAADAILAMREFHDALFGEEDGKPPE